MSQDPSGKPKRDSHPSDDPRRYALAFGCFAVFLVVAVLGGGLLFWRFAPSEAVVEDKKVDPTDDHLEVLVDTEEWILAQGAALGRLTQSVSGGALPDPDSARLFNESLLVQDLDATGATEYINSPASDQTTFEWKLADRFKAVGGEDVQLWQPLLSEVSFLHAKFYFVSAGYAKDDRDLIEAKVGFEGLAQDQQGEMLVVKASQTVHWRNISPGRGHAQWKISQWRQDSLQTIGRKRQMFHDVTQEALAPELFEQLKMSQHERVLLDMATKKSEEPFKYFSVYSNGRHPSLSVVDIDQDGLDDLYVMARIGKNRLLKNQGDGTFRDVAAEIGLDVDGFCSSAMFADFDNDGDADLILGRTLKRSMYFVNEGGKFIDKSRELVGLPLPYLVYSVSVADYNGDGLLDVFFATGAQHISTRERTLMMQRNSPFAESKMMFREFLSAEKSKQAFAKRSSHGILARVGPPNLLLANRGGRFEEAPENSQLEVWRTTTQGTWADYDDDGDPDLYLSNDYSINTMFRNDGEAGFVDVTAETNTGDIGFGMGVSWGDYDNDRRLDLYVSNMYSKAGRRITAQVETLDKRFANMARGNSLFRNSESGFEKVSGLKAPKLLVEKAGWSWGSQFTDVNNDGYLDIYALSGFYTAPKEVAIQMDM